MLESDPLSSSPVVYLAFLRLQKGAYALIRERLRLKERELSAAVVPEYPTSDFP